MQYRTYKPDHGKQLSILLLIAVLVTGCVSGCSPEIEETDLLLPLRFSSTPEGLVRTSSPERAIEIHIKGPPRFIQQAVSENLSYLVDLYTDLAYDPAGIISLIEPGEYSIPIIEERIPIRPQVKITSITPSFITVKLDRELIKRLPVQVPYSGKPAAGHIALSAVPDPLIVELKGAQSVVAPLGKVLTKPVDLTGAKEDFKKRVPLDLDDSAAVTVLPEIIVVSIPIQEQIDTRTFEAIVVNTKNSSGQVSIVPSEIEITVKGPANVLKTAGIIGQFEIYIDLKELEPGVYVRRAIIKLPVGLILTGARPELFTVTIE